MVTTRGQEASAATSGSHGGTSTKAGAGTTRSKVEKPRSKAGRRNSKSKPKPKKRQKEEEEEEEEGEEEEGEGKVEVGTKRDVEDTKVGDIEEQDGKEGKEQDENEPPAKKAKVAPTEEEEHDRHPAEHMYQTGTIERGHIYFFYRPRVELQDVHSLDDVQRFHILLVPRPPDFSVETFASASKNDLNADEDEDEDEEMNVIAEGADAVPAAPETGVKKKPFRLVSVGKKSLPDPDASGGGRGGRKATFWAIVVTVGEDLAKLQDGLGGKEYETKTRGTRHQGPARIAARGAYAIVNTEARTPSSRETHLGYYISHPTPDNLGEVQAALGIHQASSFVLQVKNPDAPNTGPSNVGLPKGRRAQFPDHIMKEVFGKGGKRGRENYGLRFASVERREMLDCEGSELLFIAARSGEEGLENSLGEGRGKALAEVEKSEGSHSIESVLKELAIDAEKIPAEPLEGEWE